MSAKWNRMRTAAVTLLSAAGLAAQKTPEEALRALTDGNRRFVAERTVPQPVGEGVRRTLARGQSPFAVVLCCSDSRVPPEHVFNCGLGELYVIRVAGNTVDRETVASIEYAVEQLNAPLCVVLGHEACEAISVAIEQVRSIDNDRVEPCASLALQGLVEQLEPAVRKARSRDLGGKALHDACEEENVHLAVHEVLRRSPLLQRFVQVGQLQMVGARYHLESGEVEFLPTRPLPPEPMSAFDPAMHSVPVGVPPHVALRMLQAGHRRFVGNGLPAGDLSAARREQLTHGQQPLAIVLTGADSRVAPEHVFDAGLGELVVIRVAGGVVTDNVLASIEQAAGHTGASLLIVMGHSRCDAMAAAATHPEGRQLTPNMRALLAHLEPSIERVRGAGAPGTEALVERAVTANVLRTATEIRARSGILRELERRGRFAVLPTVYDVASGNLTWLKEGQEDGAEPAAAPHGETAAGGHDAHGDAVSHAGDHAPAHGDGGHGGSHGGSHGNGHDEAPQTSGDHAGSGHAAGPLLEWADPEATRPAHGAHGEPAEHGAPGHGTSGHGDAGHGANEHGSGNHGPVDHGASEHGAGGHGSGGHEAGAHDAGDHGAGDHEAGAHGAGEHDAPADHGEHGHGDASTVRHAASPWQDPILIVGMAGVASLLLAAFVALVKR